MKCVAVALIVTACGRLAGGGQDASPGDQEASGNDASTVVDAAFHCDPTQPFGTPVALTEINTAAQQDGFRLTPDELSAVFRQPGLVETDAGPTYDPLLVTTRPSISEPFAPPTIIPLLEQEMFSPSTYSPSLTADGLSVFFECVFPDYVLAEAVGMCLMTRDSGTGAFATLTNNMTYPWVPGDSLVKPDGLRAYFIMSSTVHLAQHDTLTSDFSLGPAQLAPQDADAGVMWPVVTSDELTLFVLVSTTDPTSSHFATATRTVTSEPFGPLTNVYVQGGNPTDQPTWVSPDACRLYLVRQESNGNTNIYVASRTN